MSNRITRGTGLVGSLSVSGDISAASFTFGNRQDSISDPAAGDTIDAEARTAIGEIIDALEAVGILAEA